MRIFEVSAAQTLLVTNTLTHDDLHQLGFVDRRHLVIYRTPAELFPLIDYYLTHDEERRAIAQKGSALVLAQHTYAHRLQQLLSIVSRRLGLARLQPLSERASCVSS